MNIILTKIQIKTILLGVATQVQHLFTSTLTLGICHLLMDLDTITTLTMVILIIVTDGVIQITVGTILVIFGAIQISDGASLTTDGAILTMAIQIIGIIILIIETIANTLTVQEEEVLLIQMV